MAGEGCGVSATWEATRQHVALTPQRSPVVSFFATERIKCRGLSQSPFYQLDFLCRKFLTLNMLQERAFLCATQRDESPLFCCKLLLRKRLWVIPLENAAQRIFCQENYPVSCKGFKLKVQGI